MAVSLFIVIAIGFLSLYLCLYRNTKVFKLSMEANNHIHSYNLSMINSGKYPADNIDYDAGGIDYFAAVLSFKKITLENFLPTDTYTRLKKENII